MTGTLNHYWCVGIDLHKNTLRACVYCRCCGDYSFPKLSGKCRSQIVGYFAALPRPHTVAIETVGFDRWLWKTLEPIVDNIVLADATQAGAPSAAKLTSTEGDGRYALGAAPA